LIKTFVEAFEGDKKIEYLQKSLRGGNEIYKRGGHVTMVYKERKFQLKYDNRRKIIEPETRNGDVFLLDTEPLKDIAEGSNLRGLSTLFTKTVFNKNSSKSLSKSCKTVLDSAVRTFLKDIVSEESIYGLKGHKSLFPTYNDIIKYVKEFNPSVSVSKHSLSMMKGRKIIRKCVDKTPETLEFVKYVKIKFPCFKEDLFFKSC
jgi:hypothetical protein